MRRLIPVIMLSTLATTVFAFPHGCEVSGFGYNGPLLTVNMDGGQHIYLIQNRSEVPIRLTRLAKKESFMTPPLVAKLAPQAWSSFASNVKEFDFECKYIEGDNLKAADCRDVLDICQYPRAQFVLSNMGNYWVSINKSLEETIHDASATGIYLHW